MAVSWLLLVAAAILFVAMVTLVAACLRCGTKGPLAQLTSDRSSVHPPSQLLSPHSPSADPGTQQRHRSSTPTPTACWTMVDELDRRVPPAGPDSSAVESDVEDTGYIIVLPGDEAPLANQRRASTPSLDVRHDYENVPHKRDAAPWNPPSARQSPTQLSAGGEEDREYLNVDPKNFQKSSSQSDTDDEDDYGWNYVNVHDGSRPDL